MTRSLTLCACFTSALVFPACKDVSIGGDGVNSRRDGSPDVTPADLAPDLAPDIAPDIAPKVAPDVAPDVAPIVASCSGTNPAAQTCRKTANDCIPSSCSCSTDGFWRCTADCPVNVPLCTDGGAPDVPTDVAPDAVPDVASDAVVCSGANPAAQTCRKTTKDCIPSSCYCGAVGSWYCTADCPSNVPLCTDGGTHDLAPDLAGDAFVFPNDEQSCLLATNVPVCDIYVYPPTTATTSATGGPLLAKVEVTNGSCTAGTCASGCASINVVGTAVISAGATCDLLVTATDGRSRSIRISVAAFSASPTCCGYPYDGHGIWTTLNKLYFSPSPIVVDFVDVASDGGATDGAATKDAGADGANPCAKCSATEVCVQIFDGICGLGTVSCRPASDTCRSKLAASGKKSCKSIPECESEFCASPFRCVYDPPCGTESPEAALYCYGP